jgi:hypothetical protein
LIVPLWKGVTTGESGGGSVRYCHHRQSIAERDPKGQDAGKTNKRDIVSGLIVRFAIGVFGSVYARRDVATSDPRLVGEMDDDTATEEAERLRKETKVLVVVAERWNGTVWSPVKEAVLAGKVLERQKTVFSSSRQIVECWSGTPGWQNHG